MNLSKNRTQVPDAPILLQEALFIVGRYLNERKMLDLKSNFTVHHLNDSITYDFEAKEVNRTPIIIDGDSIRLDADDIHIPASTGGDG